MLTDRSVTGFSNPVSVVGSVDKEMIRVHMRESSICLDSHETESLQLKLGKYCGFG